MLMMCGIRGGPKGCRIAKMLIKDFSCNVNARSPLTRETAVHVAAYHGKAGVLEVLLRDGNDERALGEAPVRVALPEGRHRLVFRRGEREQFRYLFVGAGQSRVVDPDTM